MLTSAIVLTCALAALAQAPDAAELAARRSLLTERLTAAVDLPTARERRAAARALAKEDLAPVAEWLAVCRAFTPLPNEGAEEGGVHTLTIPLHEVDGAATQGEVVLYVPRAYARGTPSPLLLAMHGTGGAGAHMLGLWRGLCEAEGVLLLCPTEPGPNEGFAATDAERHAVLGALRWARRHFNVDEDAVFLTGFSRGGHLTWDLGLRHPDRWAALAPMVGGPRFELARGAANMRYLENALHVPLWDLQGALDQEGLVWSVHEAFRRLRALDAPRARLFEFPELGHSVDMHAADWHAFFAFRRAPIPRALTRRYAREGEGRSAWLECITATKDVREVFQPTLKAIEAAALDDDGKRQFLIDAALERTGRVEALYEGPGRFRVMAEQVSKVRLLLAEEQLGEGPASQRGAAQVNVQIGSRTRKLRARLDTGVLLEEFVERFDRSFLPVAELELDTAR